MIINLNRLNESLDKLYEGNSSHSPLTEAFDESFPKWLKDRLLTIKKYHTGGWAARKDIPYDQRPDYINARDENKYDSSTKSLFDKALKAGIDFTNTKVVEGPIPEKRTDERLKNENFIPIWLFPNGQVYIEGINDTEIDFDSGKAFKYVPMKDKIAKATGFAYIDKSKVNPNAITDKRKDRRDMRSELMKLPYYTRQGTQDYKHFGRDYWGNDYDKSGYPILNPERYRKELEKVAGKKIYQVLDDFYNRIVDAKRKVADAYSQIDPFDTEGNDRDRIRNIMNYIDYAARNYNDYMRKVEYALNAGYSEDYKAAELGRIVSRIKNDDYIKQVDNLGSQVFLSEIDWD